MTKIVQVLSSVKITVACLFWLFVLTFWGTVAQVEHGLYAAQERYFYSFFFKAAGFFPFPGAQLVLWVLFFNLVASAVTHFIKLHHWRYVGLKISHFGVLIYFVAAFITFHVMQESNVHLLEGEGTNVSSSYHEWEMAYWKEPGNTREVTACDVTKSKPGDILPFTGVPWTITVGQFYLNSAAYTKTQSVLRLLNGSGITLLEPKDMVKEREKNIAGGIFSLQISGEKNYTLLLYGGESQPTRVSINGQDYYFSLRHKRYALPFIIQLKKFKAEFHPGTNVASSYESMVEVVQPGARRDVRIYMNNPLRHKDYTFYQASYDVDAMGRQYSTLAVVRNFGQVLPYIACFVVFFGLALHFLIAALSRKHT